MRTVLGGRPDIRLHVSDDGPSDGPTLVFANSLGTDFRLWDAILPLLPPGLRIIRYDKRGHGLSDLAPGPWSMDDHINDLEAVIEAAAPERFMLVGLSVGGQIAQGFALREAARGASRLTGLVLSNTGMAIATPALWAERLAPVRAGGIEAIADAVLVRWFTEPFRTDPAKVRPWRNMLVRTPDEGYILTGEAIAGTDYTGGLSGLAAPTLVIGGDADGSTPPDVVTALAAAIPGARLEIIENAAHLPCVERPDVFAARLTEHLAAAG